ncbi:hypothetical protein BASA81_017039 [Batrachochytrium salamandrivorans]|nr:hypothetical protein BASA81_017039 [Batrachochytrium salamandrivorans]
MTQYRNACKIQKLASINDHMRICVCVHGVLYNLHLVLVPFFKRHTAQNYVKLIKVLLDSLSPIWRDKVILISSDGENTMTGHHGGVVTLLEQECLNPVLRIMVCPAPAEHCGQERDAWLQSSDLIISQQRKFLSNLMVELAGSFNMQSTSDIQLDELDHTTIIVRGNWLVEKESVIMHIHDQGSWVRDLHSSLSDFDQQSTLEEVATFAFCIVANGLQIQAERDSNNNARELEAPPVMPADLVKLRPALFIKNILDPYRNHVAKHWDQDMIDLIEIQHRKLIVVYGREPDLKAALDTHDEKTYFNDA